VGRPEQAAAGERGRDGLKGAEVTATSRKQVRDGLMAVIDYKPNRDVRSTVDLYYSQFDQKEIMRGMMWNSHQWTRHLPQPADPDHRRHPPADRRRAGQPGADRPQRLQHRKDNLFAAGWNTT
jgi:iron complex outermembrane receptor protein